METDRITADEEEREAETEVEVEALPVQSNTQSQSKTSQNPAKAEPFHLMEAPSTTVNDMSDVQTRHRSASAAPSSSSNSSSPLQPLRSVRRSSLEADGSSAIASGGIVPHSVGMADEATVVASDEWQLLSGNSDSSLSDDGALVGRLDELAVRVENSEEREHRREQSTELARQEAIAAADRAAESSAVSQRHAAQASLSASLAESKAKETNESLLKAEVRGNTAPESPSLALSTPPKVDRTSSGAGTPQPPNELETAVKKAKEELDKIRRESPAGKKTGGLLSRGKKKKASKKEKEQAAMQALINSEMELALYAVKQGTFLVRCSCCNSPQKSCLKPLNESYGFYRRKR